MNDHSKTRREIARHSRLDAEAYDEYGMAMVEMGRFAKPILGMTPPDPTSLDPRGLLELLSLGKRFRAHARPRSRQPGAAADDERRRLPRPVVRDRRAQGDDVAPRGSSARSSACARPARPTCCCTTTWARSTARSARGGCRAAAPAGLEAIAGGGARLGAEIRTEAPVARILHARAAGRPASCSRTATRLPADSSCRASTRASRS